MTKEQKKKALFFIVLATVYTLNDKSQSVWLFQKVAFFFFRFYLTAHKTATIMVEKKEFFYSKNLFLEGWKIKFK